MSAWGQSWGLSWGNSWGPVGVVPVQVVQLVALGPTGGSGWTGLPPILGEEPPAIRGRALEQLPKARRLGDSEGEPEDILPSLAARAALGGRGARARRLARAVAPVRLGGRGSGVPVFSPGERPGRPDSGGPIE